MFCVFFFLRDTLLIIHSLFTHFKIQSFSVATYGSVETARHTGHCPVNLVNVW